MSHYLIALDYDGTAGNTFVESPRHINVDMAYSLAIAQLFGHKGLEIYRGEGGHHNRAPTEIVDALLKKGCYQSALSPDKLTERLIQLKLDVLLDEVSPEWPMPCYGFLNFWQTLEELRSTDGIDLRTAVISSGHEAFIRKTFDVWGVSQPDYLVTEDDIRPRRYPSEQERRFKPGCLSLAIAHRKWLVDTRGDGYSADIAASSKPFMIYLGDDDKKDGGLANKARLPFGLFKEGARYEQSPNGFTFGDWNIIAASLRNSSQAMREGRSFSEILNQRHIGIEGRVRTERMQ